MQCIRCLSDTAEVVAKAPDKSNAWEVYCCSECNFSWRNNEVDEITKIEQRDKWRQLDKADLANLRTVIYRARQAKPENM